MSHSTGKYGIQYRPYKANTDHAGVEHVQQEGIYLKFVQGELFENEEREALAMFRFRGQFQHEDEATPVDPKYRMSTFDTNAQELAGRAARGDRGVADPDLGDRPRLPRDGHHADPEAVAALRRVRGHGRGRW